MFEDVNFIKFISITTFFIVIDMILISYVDYFSPIIIKIIVLIFLIFEFIFESFLFSKTF